ncbi:hypothetical protein [Luteimonas aquatica]|uniref:hypothetical protein n=1 Tax=Luteimonas aquatica TaxID=450364 RepID=UPI001F572A45|nr:hypothetical protein [Luteimonas aquatica]
MKLSRLQRHCNRLGLAALACGAGALLERLRPGTIGDGMAGVLTGLAFVGGAIWLAMRLMPRWWRDMVEDDYESPAGRAYRREMLPGMVLYVAAVFGSSYLIRRGIDSVPLRACVAVLPGLGLSWVTVAMVRYVRRVDELVRRIELESLGIAGLVVAQLYLVGGLLQLARVIAVPAAMAMIWVFPLLCLGYAVAKFFVRRHYR